MVRSLVFFSIILGLVMICFSKLLSRSLGLVISLLIYVLTVFVWVNFKSSLVLVDVVGGVPYVVDSVSVYFVLLTGFLAPLCVVSVWRHSDAVRYSGFICLLVGIVLGVFTVSNLFYFYVFFESALIPIYLMLGYYGSRERKMRAGYYLFMFTLGGSLFMLVGVLLVYSELGSFDYGYLRSVGISRDLESLVWLLFLAGFIVKIPLLPFHIWLAEAHVEASTEGSVLLAGVLLKLGSYGYLRYNVDLMPYSAGYYSPVVYLFGSLSLLYSSLSCIRQTDVKRVIAYGSVGHMALIIIGLNSLLDLGYSGGIVQMVAHGIVSGGLFFCIGFIYSRAKSREIHYLSGLGRTMPMFGVLFFILILGNFGFPGTFGFIGEFYLLTSIVLVNPFVGVVCGFGMLLAGGYSLYLFNRLAFGSISPYSTSFSDLDLREISIIVPIVFITVALGLDGVFIVDSI